jgi:HAD superfamily hydrolase (TIGR01549 family)
MEKIKVKAVIFDYGNTLFLDPFFDVLKLKMSEFQRILRKKGYKFSSNQIIKNWSMVNKEINYPHLTHFAQEEPVVREALHKLGIKKSDIPSLPKMFLKIYRDGYREIYKKDPRRKEVEATLIYLKNKGKKLGVFSDGRKFDVKTAMELHGVAKYFDFIIASEEIGVEKPNPLVFKFLMKKIKESPENTVYIGDYPIKDVAGAKKVGMKAILYIPPKKYRISFPWRNYDEKIKIKPDAIIKKISELKHILI